jgi:ABC-type microcin C transport system permease subunit YejE
MKSKNKFFQFLSGDFLHSPKLQRWYPYFLLLLLLAVVSIANEKMINHKNKIILQKQYEYKAVLLELQEHNYYLPYHQKKTIREKAIKRGFIENHKNIYKIPVGGKR